MKGVTVIHMTWNEIGIAVAAFASLYNIHLVLRDRRDAFVLRFSPLAPLISPGTYLYVVNRSKHDIAFLEYGFVDEDGKLFCIPYQATNHCIDDVRYRWLGIVEPGNHQESGCDIQGSFIAAYAMTSTQRSPKFSFRHEVPHWRRLRLRVFAWVVGVHGLYAAELRKSIKYAKKHPDPNLPASPNSAKPPVRT